MLIEKIEQVVQRTPGLTATQIAGAIFGFDGYHQRVSALCRELVKLGRIERRGKGGPSHALTYFPKQARVPQTFAFSKSGH
jgi:hypothetical protein